jgi:ribonuclease HI
LLRFADGSVHEMGGAHPATTNNRMELTAALALLEALKDLPRDPRLTIRTDSRYLIDGFGKWIQGWKRKGWRTASGGAVLNRELWEQLDQARLPGVELVHVKGHSCGLFPRPDAGHGRWRGAHHRPDRGGCALTGSGAC